MQDQGNPFEDELQRLREQVRKLQEALGLDSCDPDDFLVGHDCEALRRTDSWIAELWDEHPELVGYIAPGGERYDGTRFEPYWRWTGYRRSNVTLNDEELLAVAEQLGRVHPDGFTYKDVARALWGEDWTLEDAKELPSRLWKVLRSHRRFEKVKPKSGPNVWRPLKPGRARRSVTA